MPVSWIAAAVGALVSSGCIVAPQLELTIDIEGATSPAKPEATNSNDDGQTSRRLMRTMLNELSQTRKDTRATRDLLRSQWRTNARVEALRPIQGTPVYENDQITGLRIDELNTDDYLKWVGLREGDVVVAANGFELDRWSHISSAWRQAYATGKLSMIVERDGTRHVFNTTLPQ